MSDERDIRTTALLVIKQHGGSAAYYAASRADQLEEEGAQEGARTWRRILKLIEEWQATEPNGARHARAVEREGFRE